MKKIPFSHLGALLTSLAMFATGCTGIDGFGSGGYGSPYGSGYNSSPSYNSGYYGNSYQERREIERERNRLEAERLQLERERHRHDHDHDDTPSWAAPRQPNGWAAAPQREERCPSGFSQSENKCSAEERRRGCKDMRLPGGLGCVRR